MSANPSAYGKGGSYHAFIGKDSSVSLAKMDFNDDYMNPKIMHWRTSLSLGELDQLEYWVGKFSEKYKVVGYIAEDDGRSKEDL
jgi:hypothetical protein